MLRIRQEHSDVDVLIAGAGPAGASAAVHLARAGLRVMLLDQHRFPRDKVCGDFVSPVTIEELRALGVTTASGYPATNQINNAALFLDGQKLLTRPFPVRPPFPSHGRVIPRMQLDAWLVDAARHAGAQLVEGCRVQSYTLEHHSVRVDAVLASDKPLTIRARVLLGADGSTSTVARQLRGHGLDARDRIVAVRAYYDGMRGAADRADIYFGEGYFPGYFWVFPTGPRTANVGVGVALDTVPSTKVKLRELMLELVAKDEALQERLQGAKIVGKVVGFPLATFNPNLRLVGERVLLIGDAANLINPINGEGIQTAVLSGRWAAEVVSECARADDFSEAALWPYVVRVHDELRYDMALSCFLVQCIRNSVLNPLWLKALRVIAERARRDEEFADIAGGILAGVVPASSAMSPKMILGALQQVLVSLSTGAVETASRGGAEALVGLGLEAARFGTHAISEALRNPEDWLRWLMQTVASGAELATQASFGLVSPLLSPPPERVAQGGPRLLLKG